MNLNGEKLKVNDQLGNPIEIAAVVVWQVSNTAKAAFEVEDYKNFVLVQSEAAVRHLAGNFPYDN
jgi:regulator of protease activity HflC (stomatin/prohibitin superfamily)